MVDGIDDELEQNEFDTNRFHTINIDFDDMTGATDPISLNYKATADLSENDIWDAHDDPRPAAQIWCSKDLERSIAIAETLFRRLHYSHQRLKLVTQVEEAGVIILVESAKRRRDPVLVVLDTITYRAIYDYAHQRGGVGL